MPTHLLFLLIVPLATAFVVAFLGPRRGPAIRWLSLASTIVSLVVAAIVATHYATHRTPQPESSFTFLPDFVPGDPGKDLEDGMGRQPTHETTWDILPLGSASSGPAGGRPPAIQFFIGIDGLNIWLILLTAVLMVPAVLISWTAIEERVNEY